MDSRHEHQFPEDSGPAGNDNFRQAQPEGTVPAEDAEGRSAYIEIFHKLNDGLPEQIALLDAQWNILAVNSAWAETAKIRGFNELQPGYNYLQVLERVTAEGGEEAVNSAGAVVNAIHEIKKGRRSSFRHVYSGVGAREGLEFQMRIALMEMGGAKYATVTRTDVTELVQLRRLRQGFSTSLIKTQEEERRRMGREIHDSTMQQLSALGLALAQLKRTRLTGEARTLVVDIEQLLVESQRELRSLTYLAHPPQLDRIELADAMQLLVEGFGRRAGIKTSFEAEGQTNIQWQNPRLALYRLVQEALSNVHRHAEASQIWVRLVARKSMMHVVVADNGRGMPQDLREGVGLLGMRMRLAELGGRLAIRNLSPGTAIIASLRRF